MARSGIFCQLRVQPVSAACWPMLCRAARRRRVEMREMTAVRRARKRVAVWAAPLAAMRWVELGLGCLCLSVCLHKGRNACESPGWLAFPDFAGVLCTARNAQMESLLPHSLETHAG